MKVFVVHKEMWQSWNMLGSEVVKVFSSLPLAQSYCAKESGDDNPVDNKFTKASTSVNPLIRDPEAREKSREKYETVWSIVMLGVDK